MKHPDYTALVQDLAHLKPHDGQAVWTLARVVALTVAGLVLSFDLLAVGGTAAGGLWALGQGLLGLAMLQWFILLHDAGHRHFFTRPLANQVLGSVASIFSLVPFFPWRAIHDQHHLWAGWQDLDPTSQATIPRELPPAAVRVIDFCWKWWLPLFTTTFGLRNFWNLKKLQAYSSGPADRRRFLFSIALIVGVHAALFGLLGPAGWARGFALAFWVYFMLSDPLLLSQHSHVPQLLAGGEKVAPHKLWEQDVFTRGIVCPPWMSRFVLLGFDVHVGHHLLPNMPSYHLQAMHAALSTEHHIGWWTWLRAAKRLPGSVLVYQNRRMTGETL